MTGTWEYWPPEKFRDGNATVQTDLYALGCIALEALTGRRMTVLLQEPETLGDVERAALDKLTDPRLMRVLYELRSPDPTGRPLDARAVVDVLTRNTGLGDDQLGLQRAGGRQSRVSGR